jgi:methionine-rich copper-binding protein CopC
MRAPSIKLAVALAVLAPASPVLAHGELVRAVPQPGSVVSTSPAGIRLQFSERIEARFSGVEVVTSAGRRLPTGAAEMQGVLMAVPVPAPLPAGVYRVNWHVLSVDGHRTKGSFTFEVRP